MSKRDRVKAQSRRDRRMQKDQQTRAENEAREAVELEEEPVADTPEEAAQISAELEAVQKDMGMMGDMPMMNMGPTSWDEMDAQDQAEEMAQEVREVTWDTQDLVRNILNNPMIDPTTKAQKMQEVASGFEERITNAMTTGEDDPADMEKQLEQLEFEAMAASQKRHAPTLQHLLDVVKESVSYGSRKGMPDGNFALVYTDARGNKVRKYLIHDAAHVRNALARASQQMSGPGAADAKKAMPKIKAAAKKFGIEMSMEKGIHIEKDAQGDWRWIGRPSNNFMDWQGDILSKSAHQKYCAWLDQNPDMAPQFMSWHTPGTARAHPVDFWMEHEGALIMSGKLTEPEAAALFEMQKQVDIGMSVQGTGVRLNPADRHEVTDYWLVEVSDLPLDKAANPFTSVETITKEAGMDKLQYLAGLMGSEEKAKAFLQKTGQLQQDLQDAGLTSKAKDETPTPETPAQAKTPAPAPALPSMDEILKQIDEKLDLPGLSETLAKLTEAYEKVPALEAVVKQLSKSDDEKLAQTLTPPAMRYSWMKANRPSESADNTLQKEQASEQDRKLLKASPEVHWLSEVTNTAPITEQEVRP